MSSLLPEPPELTDPLATPSSEAAAPAAGARSSVEGVMITSVGEFIAVPLRGPKSADGDAATAS